ncbi:MAG: immunoglobulin-like domain-containing protein, partial [Verrucomicrobiota bacterium]
TNSATRTVNVVDTTPPRISWSFTNLVLSADTNCAALMPDVTGTNYILAVDAYSGILLITQTPTNNAVLALGTNQVVLAVNDGNGNTAYSTNTVVVQDTTPPMVTVLGDNPLTIECHGSFSDPGSMAMDNCTMTNLVTNGMVNVDVPGNYTLEYVATDAAGNSTTNTRIVNVVDTTPPTITQCASPMTLIAGTNGMVTVPNMTSSVSAIDACSGNVTICQSPLAGASLAIGTNTVIIAADDGNGNTNTCSTTVTVLALMEPMILNGQWANGVLQLTFTGQLDQTYNVLATGDLTVPKTGWLTLTNGIFGTNASIYIDQAATNYSARFYRISSP